ncbi:MAG: VCBS repeat-containing protein [Planctomycetota bacterium]
MIPPTSIILAIAPALAQSPFAADVPLTSTFGGLSRTTAGDIDADGDLDLVAIEDRGRAIAVHENAGGGRYARATVAVRAEGRFLNFKLADVDADGLEDLVMIERDGELSWSRNRGGFTFDAPTPIGRVSENTFVFDFVDLFGTGRPDLLVPFSRFGGSALARFENVGGGFGPGEFLFQPPRGIGGPLTNATSMVMATSTYSVARSSTGSSSTRGAVTGRSARRSSPMSAPSTCRSRSMSTETAISICSVLRRLGPIYVALPGFPVMALAGFFRASRST